MHTTRRDFLKSVVGTPVLLSLGSAGPAFLARTAVQAAQSQPNADTVLVVLQLTGGNDGLNTVVPYTDEAYGRQRQTLRLTAAEVLKIDDQLGLHPALAGCSRLLKEGTLSFVQGVGYPSSDRNHPSAMRDWHTALPGDSGCQTGWLGRAVDLAMTASSADAAGVFIGDIDVPFGIRARQAVVPRVRAAGDWRLRQAPGQAAPSPLMPAGEAGENPLADHVRRTAARAVAGSRQVEAVLQQAAGAGAYPEFSLAESLRCVAQLIRADLGIRMYFVELGGGGIGGFDNHANQRDNHAALLRELSESVTAFVDDLARQSLLDRVLVITFSEFGRTLTENGRRGTGHGAAAPMLLAGGRLRGGLSGAHPSLTDLEGDAPKFHTDFRRVYATCLDRWLRLDSQAVLGGRFEPLDLLA